LRNIRHISRPAFTVDEADVPGAELAGGGPDGGGGLTGGGGIPG